MGRRRRKYEANKVYGMCIRAKSSMPFGCQKIIREMIGSCLARTQRDNKVTLCHDIWNISHNHSILVLRGAEEVKNFHAEFQKKYTDGTKQLLGLEHLTLWEGRPTMMPILNLDMAIDHIAYIYANPAQDNLEESIEQYPGYSSWGEFNRCLDRLDASTAEAFPWIRLPSIRPLETRTPNAKEDLDIVLQLRADNKKTHDLERQPNEWMRCFGITKDEEVAKVNAKILAKIKEKEAVAREKRIREGKRVMGAFRLKLVPIMKKHKPKKERKIFFLASFKSLRLAYLKAYELFDQKCRECYRLWKMGDTTVAWPPGAFKPPLCPSANAI